MNNITLRRIKKFFNENILNITVGIVIMVVFVCLVLNNPYFHQYNKDEIHAWNIATDLSFIQIIKLMRAEGHTFIWYMLLKPFTYMPDKFFPWILKYLNLFFVVISIGLMWFFAPINKLFKMLIIFSYPFLFCFALLGRPYGIGILLLSLIAILYKHRLNKPILFSVILFFTANTSFIGAIAVVGICITYTYELFKIKNVKSILVMLLIPISLYIQWHNPITPAYTLRENLLYLFNFHLFRQYIDYILNTEIPRIVIITMSYLTLIYFRNNLKLLFSIVISYSIFISLALCLYGMFDYHYLFMFILFCIFYWIYTDNTQKESSNLVLWSFNTCFLALCIILSPFIRIDGYWFRDSQKFYDAMSCLYKNVPQNSVIYTTMFSLGHEIPYIRDKYVLKTFNGDDLLTYDSYFNTYTSKLKYITYDENKLKSMDVGSRNKFIVVNGQFLTENFAKTPAKVKTLNDKFVKSSTKCEYLYINSLDD